MGRQSRLAGWAGCALFIALVPGCAGTEGQDPRPGAGSPTPAAVGGARVRVVTEIEPGRSIRHRPRFTTLAPLTAREGEPYHYGFAALDPDQEEVSYTLVRAPEGAVLEGKILEWTPKHAQVGHRQRFTLRAVDEHGAGRDQAWSVIPRAETGIPFHRHR